jgi:hypothetical protein
MIACVRVQQSPQTVVGSLLVLVIEANPVVVCDGCPANRVDPCGSRHSRRPRAAKMFDSSVPVRLVHPLLAPDSATLEAFGKTRTRFLGGRL